MSDSNTTETNQAEATTATETPPSASANVRTFTQEEVNRLTAKAREEGRQRAAKAPTGNDAGGESLSLKEIQDRLAESELRRGFDRRAMKLGIDDDAADDLFDLYKAQKPQDPQAWFDAKASRFGLKANVSTNPTNPQSNAPAQAAPAAAPSAPSKVDQITSGGVVDYWNISSAQLEQLGPAGVRDLHEKALSVGRQLSGAPPRPSTTRK